MKIGITIRSNMVRAIVCAGTVTLAGCSGAGQTFDYAAIDQIPAGPGLVSGDQGAFVYTLKGDD